MAQELPNILCWVQLSRIGGQEQDRSVFRDLQCAGFVPTRTVHDDYAVGFGGDGQAELLKMFCMASILAGGITKGVPLGVYSSVSQVCRVKLEMMET